MAYGSLCRARGRDEYASVPFLWHSGGLRCEVGTSERIAPSDYLKQLSNNTSCSPIVNMNPVLKKFALTLHTTILIHRLLTTSYEPNIWVKLGSLGAFLTPIVIGAELLYKIIQNSTSKRFKRILEALGARPSNSEGKQARRKAKRSHDDDLESGRCPQCGRQYPSELATSAMRIHKAASPLPTIASRHQ